MKSGFLDNFLLVIIIIGAINWGIAGFFRIDLIAYVFGTMSWFTRILYVFIGMAGIYSLSIFQRMHSHRDDAKNKVS